MELATAVIVQAEEKPVTLISEEENTISLDLKRRSASE